jgi:DNA processing protein
VVPRLSPLTFDDLEPANRTHELAATAALIRSGSIPAGRLGVLIEQIGSAVRLVQMSDDDELTQAYVAAHELLGAVEPRDVEHALDDVRAWEERGLDARGVLDAHYPESLHDIFNRPPLLFVEGQWPATREPAVAVVGARAASADGLQRAHRLATELSEAGYVILSGLAKGIDTQAHRAALAAGGITRAVMGTGLNHRYPSENAELSDEIIAAGGGLLSQFFPAQRPARWTFPNRNIVMSGLALATVVVEATETSGARQQARVALQHGRTVFLLRSLVAAHPWARGYVEEGAYGTRAIEVASTGEIVDRLEGRSPPGMLSVA